ncbi:serine/threonine protein kinase [Candidatus Woesearchaeota archaeon]|nr:serine/threonine protein kinase [Candidatus Woesearchaeota archaeon]
MNIGDYRIIKKIGEGGFGEISQVEHIILNEKACMKQNKIKSEEYVDLLRYEAKLIWRLDEHHSVPSVKGFFMTGENECAMIIRYIEGQTLYDIVENNSRLHPEDVCWITQRLLWALYYVHSYGVIHTDVKPQNVFVEPGKRDIKLIDFGIASYKPKSGTAPIGFTPMYAAPELEQEKPPIPETDIYGAGITMLYALGGDISKKTLPKDTPKPIADFCNSLIRYNPIERPNWDKDNPLERLSDIRLEIFGRRHIRE